MEVLAKFSDSLAEAWKDTPVRTCSQYADAVQKARSLVTGLEEDHTLLFFGTSCVYTQPNLGCAFL